MTAMSDELPHALRMELRCKLIERQMALLTRRIAQFERRLAEELRDEERGGVSLAEAMQQVCALHGIALPDEDGED